MPIELPSQLARKVLVLLDAQAFFDHWSEKFRDPQPFGTAIKAHCPFHPVSERFRSFLLDLRKKTFCCTFTQCKAAAGGSFVTLHALLTGKSELEALLDLCSVFAIDLSPALRLELGEALAAHARELLEAKKPEAAENFAALALKENPTSPAIRLLLAQICEARDRPADARPHYEAVLREALEAKEWTRAAGIVERLLALAPEQPAYAEQAALVAEAQGRRPDAAQYYLELAQRPDAGPDKQRAWLERAHRLAPARPDVLEGLGALYEEAGDPDAATAIWEALANQLHFAGQPQDAIAVLDRLVRLHPDREDLQEQRAHWLLAADRPGEAADLFETLAEQALEQGAFDRAERHLRRACEARPDNVENHWRLMELLEQVGRREEALFIADRLLGIGGPEVLGDRYGETLNRLKQWDPHNIASRERLIAHYTHEGEIQTAVEELRELIELCFQRNLRTEALERAEAMHVLLADQPRGRLELAKLLAAHDCAEAAAAEYEAVARASLPDDPALAEEACRTGLEVDAARDTLHELLLQVYLLDRPDQAIAQTRALVDLYRAQGNVTGALAVLERVKERLPEAIEVRLSLAQLAAETGEIDRAIEEVETLATLDLTAEARDRAAEVAGELAERHGPRLRLLQALASLHRARQDVDALVETLLRLAAVQRTQVSSEAAESTYLEVFAVRPDEPRALHGHAELVRTERGFAAAKPLYQRYVSQLLSAGHADEAVRVYTRCIEWAPEDVDCRRALGDLLADQEEIDDARTQWEAAATTYLTVHDNPAAAAGCYEAILARCPDDINARKNLAHVQLLLGNADAAVQSFIQAADQLGALSDVEGQIALYRTALKVIPGHVTLTRHLADALHAAGQQDQALSLTEDLLALQDDKGATADVAETLRKLLELAPERAELRERLAGLLLEAGDPPSAAQEYRTLAEQHTRAGQSEAALAARLKVKEFDPADVKNRRALIEIHQGRNDTDAVKRELDELATVYRHGGNLERAVRILEERLELDPDDLEHRVVLAEMRVEAGEQEAAADEFCRLGETFQDEGNEERARQMVQRALQLRPGDNKFRRRLIKVSLREADPARVVSELGSLAEAFFNTGETDEGLDCCRQMLKAARKNARLQADVAHVYASHGYTDDARETYDRAIQRSQRSDEPDVALGIVERALADFPSAEELWRQRIALDRALERFADAFASTMNLTLLMRQKGAPADQVEAVFREALEMAEPTADLLEAVIDFYVEENRIDNAVATLRLLGKLHDDEGAHEAAIAAYDRLCAYRPADEQALSALVRLHKATGEDEAARDCCIRLAMQYKTLGQWDTLRSLLEPLLAEYGPDEQTLPLLTEAARGMGDHDAERRYAQAWTDYLEERGRADEAIQACEKVLESAPTDWDSYQRLADLYSRRGDGEQQAAVLSRMAKTCEEAGEIDRALAARLQIRTLDPENVENLVALGAIYRRAERLEDAAPVLCEAFELLVNTNQTTPALELGPQILEIDPTQDSVRERLAALYADREMPDRAAEMLSQLGHRLVESAPQRAVEVFRQALQFQSTRAADRQALAALMAQTGEVETAISEYIQASLDFSRAGDPAASAASLEAVLALEPDHRLGREMLVQMRLAAGEAAQATNEAVALAEQALAESRSKDAERILLQAAEAGPEQAVLACERLADFYIGEGRTEEALHYLGPLVEKARRDANMPKLAAYLEKICDLVPVDHEHRIELVEISLEQDNLHKALEHFRKLLPSLIQIGLLGEGDRVGQLILAQSADQWEIKEEIARIYVQARLRDLAVMTYLDMASTARGDRHFERVVDYATSALGLDPENTAAHEMLFEANLNLNRTAEAFHNASVLSACYDDQDRPEKALAMARKMVELLPQDPGGYERLSELLEKQGIEDELGDVLAHLAERYLDDQRMDKAIETLGRYLVIRPDDVEVRKRYVELAAQAGGDESELVDDYAALINAAVERGDPTEAERLFGRALEIEPDNIEIRERWVEFLYDRDRADEGHQALVNLAGMLLKRGKPKRAGALVAEAAQRFPNAAVLHAQQAELDLAANAKGRAIESLRKALHLFHAAGDTAAASAASERILEVDPLDVTTRAALVESLLNDDQIERALKHGRSLAAQYFERSLYDLAERQYRRIVQHDPEDLEAWMHILDIIQRMGEQREHVSDYLLVAELLARRGLFDESARLYRQVVQIDPQNIEARRAYIDTFLQVGVESDLIPDYLELADLFASQGLPEEAVRLYERVLMMEPNNAQAAAQVERLRVGLADEQTVVSAKEGAPVPDAMALDGTPLPAPKDPADAKALQEAIDNYRQILESKPESAMIRKRMADLLYRLGRVDEAVEEWDQASTQFYDQGEMEPVIRLCEKILKIDPGRTGIRDRLSRANLKKDSMAAIESAIESLESEDFEFKDHQPRER